MLELRLAKLHLHPLLYRHFSRNNTNIPKAELTPIFEVKRKCKEPRIYEGYILCNTYINIRDIGARDLC